ncbi:MAG TPA: aminotransferase class V-fold PLP-dependent enzyme [Gemmatimonadales bacterium]|nr:aminotransferase class V-fold PLP-dependent enzyme [Gemmatimonadales bacterium]
MTHRHLLQTAATLAADYLDSLPTRGVAPTAAALDGLRALDRPFPEQPSDPEMVLRELDARGSPATIASAGGRFFGFVVGGSLPAALAANVLAAAWDQDAGMTVLAPGAAAIEAVALRWVLDALHLPPETGGGFVTGATMANFTGLAAARYALLARAGWDVQANGLFGAPSLTVVVGDEVHVSVIKALGLLGLGQSRVVRVPTDAQGRMRADKLPALDARTIACTQAGNVNTGACDPVDEVSRAAHKVGAWVHVDGAFGLWARSAPARAPQAAGVEEADSWALDAHKWLNVPYDSGVALCRDAAALRSAMVTGPAAYLVRGTAREPDDYTPELSRRARGLEIWAALASLGRSGLAELVERCCRHATRFATGLREAGYEVLNDVTLNQVLVRFGDDARTRKVIEGIQADRTCWCGGTMWQGRAAMRISVSSWATTGDDVERSLAAMIDVARSVG